MQLFRHLPLGLWLLGMVIGLSAEPRGQGAFLGTLLNHANAVLARSTPRAVLVSRLRQQVKQVAMYKS